MITLFSPSRSTGVPPGEAVGETLSLPAKGSIPMTRIPDTPVQTDSNPVAQHHIRDRDSAHLAELLTGAGRRDSVAFTELYDRTAGRVFGLILRVIGNAGMAEEVTQEVYLHIWRGGAVYVREKGSPVAFLLTLAHARAVDRVRSERARTDREALYGSRNHVREYDVVAEEVGQRATGRAVRDGLHALTELQRQSIEMAYFDGNTYRQVASLLGVALPTAKSRIRDGLNSLCRTLSVDNQ